MWQQWVSAVLGVVLFVGGIAGVAMLGAAATPVWIMGLVIAILGFWGASVERVHMHEGYHGHGEHAHQA